MSEDDYKLPTLDEFVEDAANAPMPYVPPERPPEDPPEPLSKDAKKLRDILAQAGDTPDA